MRNIRPQKRDCGNSDRRFLVRVDSRRIRRASFFIFVACWLASNASLKARSQNEEGAEYPVKLAFLYNFTKFVDWPPGAYHDPGASLLICIVGHDPFSQDLEGQLRTRTVGDRPVDIRTLRPSDNLSACQIVFVPVTEKDRADRILKGLKGASALTVGETPGFAALGGVVNLTVEGNKVHFEVNLLAAERANLKISSKLLGIAKIVGDQGHGGKS
jgi:YfiR/HmsC-like